jgi:hypothetical protein
MLDFAHDSTDVLCNSEHPEHGRLRQKHVGVSIEGLYNICAFPWLHLTIRTAD